jgi:hypothetical protein
VVILEETRGNKLGFNSRHRAFSGLRNIGIGFYSLFLNFWKHIGQTDYDSA